MRERNKERREHSVGFLDEYIAETNPLFFNNF